ncbi:unnamed protein product [Pieris brassicae]|uniref:Uncharacterized protein n=1 Tax=Pieris brassicae TaxID=7116 RepID=A0A9P0XE24_PIEBR|nr:unnamed protein product [Pieris brassicae]
MRACLLVCAALALAPGPWARAAATTHEPARLQHIKTQILAKLGLSSRPTPLGTPPRDVVRQILARAADPYPEPPQVEHSMKEIIAIAHRGINKNSWVNQQQDYFIDSGRGSIDVPSTYNLE